MTALSTPDTRTSVCRIATVGCRFVGDRIAAPLTLTAACGWTHTATEDTVQAATRAAQAAYQAHPCQPAASAA